MEIKSWKARSKHLRTEIVALYLASEHPRTPWYAKALAAFIIGYALSPIDLIPDFVPVVGYLDDLIIIPAGIASHQNHSQRCFGRMSSKGAV